MSARRLFLVAALVSAVVGAVLLYLPPAHDPSPAVPTLPATATETAGATAAEASATEPVASDAPNSAKRDINLALVIDPVMPSGTIPQDPAARLAQLVAAVEAGAPDAADELFLLAYRCSEQGPIPMPSTEQAYHEAREHLMQTRTFTEPGPTVPDLDRALSALEQGYRLCSAFARMALPGHAHWNRVAAELGSHYAMVVYWEAQTGTGDWEAVQARSIEYLERARDDGYMPAFVNIGSYRGGLNAEGPFNPDHTEALAHFYASADLQAALIAAREESGYYAEDPRLRYVDSSLQDTSARFVRLLEMQVSPYQMQAARARADELLDRCCR